MDSACFEYDANPFETSCEAQPDWDKLLIELEAYIEKFPKEGRLAPIRVTYQAGAGLRENMGQESTHCRFLPAAVRLIPACGFALAQAKKNEQRRIFISSP